MTGRERVRRWTPLVAALLAAATAVSAGVWQLGRGAEKRELRDRFERLARDAVVQVGASAIPAPDVELRRVSASGTFLPDRAVYLDNRVADGVAGFHVIMPLEVGGGMHVLVNRGWIAGRPDRAQLPEVRTPAGVVTVGGVAVVPGRRLFELSSTVTEGAVWQNLTIERYRAAHPVAIQPFVLRQDSPLDDGLKREWSPPDFGIDKHYAYAAQWFLLAATVILFYGYAHVRRRRAQEKEPD
jgi:surfeit locus 1 family protein